MARGELTLAATGSGIPTLTLTDFDADGQFYQRSELRWSAVSQYSNNGVAQITKPAGNLAAQRYRWDLGFLYAEQTALQIGAMLKWCEADVARSLTLTDEIAYLDPEPGTHSKTLVSVLNPAGYTGTWQYGFGVFSVRPVIEGAHREWAGSVDGGWAETVNISLQGV